VPLLDARGDGGPLRDGEHARHRVHGQRAHRVPTVRPAAEDDTARAALDRERDPGCREPRQAEPVEQRREHGPTVAQPAVGIDRLVTGGPGIRGDKAAHNQ
jgi:uncharacterized protein (DUF2336 family)